jgi:tetratricopeptide (TPR) repeat protein
MALTNLGIRFSGVGRRADAVAPTEEAVALRREQAANNPAFQPNLATALTNLGNRYSEVGRRADAVAPTEEAAASYRVLAVTNPAFQPNLAMALTNLGIRFSGVGRRADAVAPTEEAVAFYRVLAVTNPAFQPDLAGALNNLGTCYSGVGRFADAVAPTEEAVASYRVLAVTNPAFQPDLAMALNNLGTCYTDLGDGRAGDRVWQGVVADVPPAVAAYLLLARISAADDGVADATAWIATAISQAGDERSLVAALHDQARRHRSADPDRFDQAWAAYAGTPAGWLTVDVDLLATARAWINTVTYADEHDHLALHPELLTSAADDAVVEALLTLDESHAARYTELRDAAQSDGVVAVYRPLLLTVLAGEFVAADPQAQAVLLRQRRDDLMTDTVRAAVARHGDEGDTAEAHRANAVLALAQIGAAEVALDALTHPDRFPSLLAAIAEQPDNTALDATAFLARSIATTSPTAADADFYIGVAAAITGDLDDATRTLTAARRLDPTQITTWINRLAVLGQRHPTVLDLITVLTSPLDDPTGAAP